jgi:hypothetical protein
LSEEDNDADFTEPQLISYYGGQGRGMDKVISYYTINQDNIAPPSPLPSIDTEDPEKLDIPEDWFDENQSFTLSAGDCLWEVMFFKFDKADADG